LNLQINLEQSEEIQKFLCILNLGMLDSLLERALTFEEAYAYLYRPYVAQLLNENEANKAIVELFEECCMLEDISDIAPEKLNDAIKLKKKETLNLLKTISSTAKSMYWLNSFDE
jgi:endonuclease III